MDTYKCKKDRSSYHSTSLFNLIKHVRRCIKPVGSHIHRRSYDGAGAASSEAAMASEERVGINMGDEALEEEDGASKVEVRDA